MSGAYDFKADPATIRRDLEPLAKARVPSDTPIARVVAEAFQPLYAALEALNDRLDSLEGRSGTSRW